MGPEKERGKNDCLYFYQYDGAQLTLTLITKFKVNVV